jgi:hypothetical protein
VNGYPEWLDAGEDTAFDINLREAGKRFYLNKDAIVYWNMFDGYSGMFHTYFKKYSYSDGLALQNIGYYLFKFLMLFMLYSLGIFSLYIHWSMVVFDMIAFLAFLNIRSYFKQKGAPFNEIFLGGIILFIVEIASLTGFLYGLTHKVSNKIMKFQK